MARELVQDSLVNRDNRLSAELVENRGVVLERLQVSAIMVLISSVLKNLLLGLIHDFAIVKRFYVDVKGKYVWLEHRSVEY